MTAPNPRDENVFWILVANNELILLDSDSIEDCEELILKILNDIRWLFHNKMIIIPLRITGVVRPLSIHFSGRPRGSAALLRKRH